MIRDVRSLPGLLLAAMSAGLVVTSLAPAAQATITPSSNALTIAQAIASPSANVTGASLVAPPSGAPDGVSTTALTGFPTQGPSFGVLTSGNVRSVGSPGTVANALAPPGPAGGATVLLQASSQITPGPHSLYLSLFDQGDHSLDSAVFLDNLVVGFVPDPAATCAPGARPADPPISATGKALSATEGNTFNGAVATFTDADTSATASEYAATIDWGDGSPTTAGP